MRGGTGLMRFPRAHDNAGVAKREPIDLDVLSRDAQGAVLSALARGGDAFDILAAVAPADVANRFAPDVALLELSVTALDLACPSGAEPLEYDGLRERYLLEVTFRGRVEHRNSQYALYAAACMRGGLQPDLLSDAGWWQTPALAVRPLRRRHLQPGGGRAAGGTGRGGHSADRRPARPRARSVTSLWSRAPGTADEGVSPGRMDRLA